MRKFMAPHIRIVDPEHIALTRGGIYIVRAIELKFWKSPKPEWEAPGWGVHLEGLLLLQYADDGALRISLRHNTCSHPPERGSRPMFPTELSSRRE